MTKHAVPVPVNSAVYPSREPVDLYSARGRKRLTNFSRYLQRHRQARRALFATTPPSPRLVGIETNPGPPKPSRIPVLRAPATHVDITVGKGSGGSAQRRRRSGTPGSHTRTAGGGGLQLGPSFRSPSFKTQNTAFLRSSPTMNTYLNALMRPFTAPQPRLGWGCFVPSMKYTGWYENPSFTVGATSTCFAVSFRPSVSATALTVYTAASSASAISASTTAQSGLTNNFSLSTLCQTARIISAEVRVKVRCPATSLPGSLGGMYIPDDTLDNVAGSTFAQVASLQKYVPFSSEAQSIGGAVQYRPSDPYSFVFNPTIASINGIGGNVVLPNLVIVGTGWAAANFALEISIVTHFEALAGADAAGQVDFEPSLVTSGISMDQVGERILEAGAPVVPSISALEMLDHGLTHALGKSSFSTGSSVAPSRR